MQEERAYHVVSIDTMPTKLFEPTGLFEEKTFTKRSRPSIL